MKLTNKALFPLLFHLLLSVIYGQENQYRLKGVINNRFNELPVMLFALNENSILRVDTTDQERKGKERKGRKEYLRLWM